MNLVKNCNIGNHIKTLAIVPKSQHHGFLFPLQMKRLCMEKVHSYRKRVTFCAKIIEQLVRPTDGRVLGKRGNRMHETNRTLTLWRTARATISHTHQYRSTNFQPGCSCSIAFLRFSSSFSVARQKWYNFRKPTIGKRPFFFMTIAQVICDAWVTHRTTDGSESWSENRPTAGKTVAYGLA